MAKCWANAFCRPQTRATGRSSATPPKTRLPQAPSMPPATSEQMTKPSRFELRMALAYAVLFLATGVQVPYFPIWLEGHGFSPADIAVVLSAPMFLRVFTTPLITTLADKASDRANTLTLLVAASALLSLGYFLPPTYAIILLVSLALAIFLTPHPPMLDSIALSGVRRWGCSYTSMRVWGTVSYLIATMVGGVVLSIAGSGAVPVLMTLGLAILFAVSFLVPRIGPPRRVAQNALDALARPGAFDRRFVYAVIGAGLIAGSHSFINSFMSIYWKSIGYGDTLIGLLWSFSVVAEVCVFWVFPKLFAHRNSTDLLLISAAAAILRWTIYPLIGPLGFGAVGYFGVQAMHSVSTGLMLIAVQKLIGEEIAEERTGAAQGLAFFATGISVAAVTLSSGPLYEALGPYGTVPMIGVASVAAGMILLAKRQPQSSAVGGATSEPA